MKTIFDLFLQFLQVGLFSIGGGYATLPLIQQRIVETERWLSSQAFSDIVTISQMTPGPLAVNASTFVGLRIGGSSGAAMLRPGRQHPDCRLCAALQSAGSRNFSGCPPAGSKDKAEPDSADPALRCCRTAAV